MLRDSGSFEIVGALDPRDEAISAAEAEEGKTIRRYESMAELCADPQVEAVFIATPAHLHLAQGWEAARAGKALFIEKPLGHDLKECRKLVEYCEANNIPHGHGFSVPLKPLWVEVKRLLDTGLLGQIVSVAVSSMSTGGYYFPPDNWRFKKDKNPGGQLFQCGIHKIDMIRRLLGEGTWHAGFVRRDITSAETDDGYVLMGEFGSVPVTFHSHYVAAYRHTMEIYGTEGDIFVTEFPDKLEYKKTDFTGGVEPVLDWTGKIPDLDPCGCAMRDFAAAVRERRQPLMNGRDGLRALELIFEAIRISKPITSRIAGEVAVEPVQSYESLQTAGIGNHPEDELIVKV